MLILKLKNNTSRLILILIFSFILLLNIIPAKTFAAVYTSSNNPMETEYIQWKAYRIVRTCIEPRDTIDLNASDEQDLINNLFAESNGSGQDVAGGVYSVIVGYSRHIIDCNTKNEIVDHALKHLGFSNIRNFADEIESRTGSRDIGGIQGALDGYMRAEKLGGKGANGALDLSEAAKFWYWSKVYRWGTDKSEKVEGDFATCGGIFSNKSDKTGTKIGGGFYWYKTVDNRLAKDDLAYAYYDLDTGVRLGGLDNAVLTDAGGVDLGGNNPTCREVAQALTSARRDSYITRMNQYADENPDIIIDDGGEDGSDPTEAMKTCESEGGALSAVLCSGVDLLGSGVIVLDAAITNLLTVPNDYTGSPQLRAAWARLRNLAYILLVPITLVMVIGTAMGFEFISAYTVKRAMPRLIIAAIFIALSYDITKFIIEVVNGIGTGIYGMVASAMLGSNTETLSFATIFKVDGGNWVWGLIAGGGAIVGIAAIGSIGVLLSYLLVMLLGILIGFILLAVRQFLIVGLMILAPLAILAWIFPGNDKLWKLWWGSFSKLLLLFPMIMLVLAVGRSFALIVQLASHGNADFPMIATLVKFVAYIGPFFFIPAMFKFAGGGFANLAGMANNKSRGLFDRSKQYRGKKMASNWQETKAGEKKFRPAAFNHIGERVGVGVGGRFGFGAQGRTAVKTQRRNIAAERASKDEELKQLGLASDEGGALMFLSGGTEAGGRVAREELYNSWLEDDNEYQAALASEDVVTQQARQAHHRARADEAFREAKAVGFTRSRAQAAGSLVMQNKARAIAGGPTGMAVLEAGLNRLHGEGASSAGAREETRQAMAFFARGSGRADLGAVTPGGDRAAVIDGYDRTGASSVAHGHTTGVIATTGAILDEYNEARDSGDYDRQVEAASRLTALRNAETQQTPEANKRAIAEALEAAGIDLESGESVDEQFGRQIGSIGPPRPVPPLPAALGSTYSADEKQQYDDAVTAHQAAVAANAAPAHATTARIRNRAGLYDQGTGRQYNPAVQGQQGQDGQGGGGTP